MRTFPASGPPEDGLNGPAASVAGRPAGAPVPVFAVLVFDAFSAQVLAARRPDLRGRPFAVVRQTRNGHKAAIFSCSPEAAALGIRPGLPVPALERKFPRIPVVPRDERLEAQARGDLEALCETFTPDAAVRSDGTALLDLTGTPLMRECSLRDAGARLREAARAGLGFARAAAGLAGTPLAAQVLARLARPDGLRFCAPGAEREALAALPAGLLPGLSPAARERIAKYALTSIGQLLALGRETLLGHFGKEGERLYALAAGHDLSAVRRAPERIEAEIVLERDANDADALDRLARLAADRLAFRLRREGCAAGRFSLEIRYADHKSARRAFACPRAVREFDRLAAAVRETLRGLYTRRVALRSIRLAALRPGRDEGQLDLFRLPGEERQIALAGALDRIRIRHSFGAVLNGSSLEGG
jgi:DNA polymerase-4